MNTEKLEFTPAYNPRKYNFGERAGSSSGRVLQVFLNTDMRNRHDGLTGLAKENNIDVKKLLPGQFVVFVNREKTQIALFAAYGVIAYQKLTGGNKADLRAIAEIPKVFKGTNRLDYDAALKTALEKAFERKRKAKEQSLP